MRWRGSIPRLLVTGTAALEGCKVGMIAFFWCYNMPESRHWPNGRRCWCFMRRAVQSCLTLASELDCKSFLAFTTDMRTSKRPVLNHGPRSDKGTSIQETAE